MSEARAALVRALHRGVNYSSEAHDLINAYAHELAEKQRAAEAQWRQSGYAGTRSKGWLIDLIDPEVLNSGG
ncbi:hypothetical protein ACWC1C_01335 [Streptomyces sp. NPDC001705]